MAINDSFNQIIEEITAQVLQKVQENVQGVVTNSVHSRLNEILSEERIQKIVLSKVQENIASYTPDLTNFENHIKDAGNTIIGQMKETANRRITELATETAKGLNIDETLESILLSKLDTKLKTEDKYISINLHETGRIEYKITWKEDDESTVDDITESYNYVRGIRANIF